MDKLNKNYHIDKILVIGKKIIGHQLVVVCSYMDEWIFYVNHSSINDVNILISDEDTRWWRECGSYPFQEAVRKTILDAELEEILLG